MSERTASNIDWTAAPDWANYVAVNSKAQALWFENKPWCETRDDRWYVREGRIAPAGYIDLRGLHWQSALFPRPTAEQVETIDTGDTVHHLPSDEHWIVAGVAGQYLWPVGWPPGRANVSDCVLVEKATPAMKAMVQADLARLRDDERRQFGVAENTTTDTGEEMDNNAISQRYQKRPIIIDAFQLTKEQFRDLGPFPDWTRPQMQSIFGRASEGLKNVIYVDTLEGRMYANVGDYIIRGVKGEVYPCKPDIFEASYDLVQDALSTE